MRVCISNRRLFFGGITLFLQDLDDLLSLTYYFMVMKSFREFTLGNLILVSEKNSGR